MNERKQAYITFCEQTPSLPLFLRPWWLDAVTMPDNKEWDVLLARNKKGEIEAVFPFQYGKKAGLSYALCPQLTQYTGFWAVPLPEDSSSQRLLREKLLQNDIIRQLEALGLSYFEVKFPLNYTHGLPFYWSGYNQRTRYTSRIENIGETNLVWANFDYAKRKQIQKAQEAGIETAADFFRESSKDEGRHYKILEGILERYF